MSMPPPAAEEEGPARWHRLSLLRATYLSRWTLVSVATICYHLSGQILRPLLPLRLSELGAGDALIGVIVAVNPLITVVLALPSGRVVDRLGVGRIQSYSMVVMVAGGVGYAFAGTVPALLLLQVLAGVAELGTWLGLQATITHAGTGTFRTRHLSLFALAWGSGLAFGPSIGGPLYEAIGFHAVAWWYSALAAAGAIASAFAPRVEASGNGDDRPGLRGALKQVLGHPAVRGVLIATFGCLTIGSLRATYYPLFLEREGISVSQIGLLLSTFGIASLLVRTLLPWLLPRFDPAYILIGGMAVATLAMGATPLIVPHTGALFLAAATGGAGVGLMPPLTVEMLTRFTPEGIRGVAMATRVMTNRAAMFVQPLLFGAVAGTAGLAFGFMATGLLLAGLTTWTVVETRRVPPELRRAGR